MTPLRGNPEPRQSAGRVVADKGPPSYLAECEAGDCRWWSADGDVQAKARQHVAQTGHTVRCETTVVRLYWKAEPNHG